MRAIASRLTSGIVRDPMTRAPRARTRRPAVGTSSTSIAQRRHANRRDADAVEQVLTETPVGDLPRQVAVGRREEADIETAARATRRRA